jgi:two-component system cell cycle sensor histidine kinase/response regulator CckA
VPFDQQLEIMPAKASAGMPQKINLLAAGCACLLMATLIPHPALRLGFGACGSLLTGLAVVLLASEKLQVRSRGQLRGFAQGLILHDMSIGFVTNGAGYVTFANAAAKDRFDETEGRSLTQVFGIMLANPGSVLSQLLDQAKVTGSHTEDIVTRGGHFRLRVLIMGPDCQLWWLDDLTTSTRPGARQNLQAGFPMLTANADGRVAHMNESFKMLVGGGSNTSFRYF